MRSGGEEAIGVLPGQYWDKETSLHYNYFRDGYDPSIGRYTQSDPIGLAGGSFSTYGYVGGNPVKYSDPAGLVRQIDPNGEECKALKKKIQNKKGDINKRIQQCALNPDKLPYYPPYPGASPRMSVQGHEEIIQDIKDALTDDEALYRKKCGGDGGGGGSATAPATSPLFPPAKSNSPNSSNPSNNAGAAAAVGSALFIFFFLFGN